MRFPLISPDLLEGSSKVKSQYSTHVNLKNARTHTMWLVDGAFAIALPQQQQAVTRAVRGRRLLRSRSP